MTGEFSVQHIDISLHYSPYFHRWLILEAILSEFFLIPDAKESDEDSAPEHEEEFELEEASLDDDVATSLAFAQRLVLPAQPIPPAPTVTAPPIPAAPTVPPIVPAQPVSTPAGRSSSRQFTERSSQHIPPPHPSVSQASASTTFTHTSAAQFTARSSQPVPPPQPSASQASAPTNTEGARPEPPRPSPPAAQSAPPPPPIPSDEDSSEDWLGKEFGGPRPTKGKKGRGKAGCGKASERATSALLDTHKRRKF